MTAATVIRAYLRAMAAGDLAGVLDTFSADGVVVSPVYGAMAVRPFYEQLFADTIATEVRIRHIYVAEDEPRTAIAHFDYVWTRRDKPTLETRLIDLFDLDPEAGRITRLRIVMDGGAE